MNIGLLTDSTCDLDSELLDRYNINTVPLNINFSGDIYKDGIDISSQEFFLKMIEEDDMPGTSQPSAGLFLDKYKEMAKEYDVILSMHISAKLSGTIESARLAAKQMANNKINLFNSQSTTLGLGFLVLLAAKLIEKNYNIKDIISILNKTRDNVYIYFSVNDLEYLKKGGRIGKAQALLGSVLNFNPILQLNGLDGEVMPYKKVRGNKKTRKEMLNVFENIIANEENVWIGILKGKINNEVNNFVNELKLVVNSNPQKNTSIKKSFISSVLASHTGPYVYGFVVLKGDFLDAI